MSARLGLIVQQAVDWMEVANFALF